MGKNRHLGSGGFQFKLAKSRIDGLGFESIGIGTTLVGSLVGFGTDVLGPLQPHSFIEENLHRVGHSFKAVFG
jgi:hypothetical protein